MDPVTPIAEALDAAGLPVAPILEPVPPIYRLTEDDLGQLDADVPKEFKGATLTEGARNILNEWRPTVALIGPPGTGKTRLCWAALRGSRITAARVAMTHGTEPPRDMDHYDRATKRNVPRWIKREAWVPGEIKRIMDNSRVRIISEVSDIRRNRHNREWLDETAHWKTHDKSLLCIDDIGFTGKADDWVLEAIYEIANVRRSHGMPTLYTTNLQPDQMRDVFGAAITSRILGGEIIPLDGKDRRLA